MHIRFLGAAGTVTGSKYLVETGRRRILVDCGMFQGKKELRLRNWQPLKVEPTSIDTVLLTHSHLDHSGWLPALVSQGFAGWIRATRAATEVCGILLPDAGRIQEQDAGYANRHGFSKHTPALPLFTEEEALQALDRFDPVPWRTRIDLGDGLHATFLPVGHLLGAAMILLEDGERSVLFSGDVGRPHDLLLPPPDSPPAADMLVVESTYGDRQHETTDPSVMLADMIQRTSHRGGAVIMPTFCVGRVQEVILLLARLKAANAIPDVPVYLDSPMAIDATALYFRYHGEHRLTTQQCEEMGAAIHIVRSVEESKRVTAWQGPMVVLAGSGMATGGRVLHHLKAFAPDARNTILFAGYQAEGTRGSNIIQGAKSVRIHGRDVAIRAEVAHLGNLSAHADANELLAWLQGMPRAPKQVFVTHGEPEAANVLAGRITRELGWPALVPALGDSFDLTIPPTKR